MAQRDTANQDVKLKHINLAEKIKIHKKQIVNIKNKKLEVDYPYLEKKERNKTQC